VEKKRNCPRILTGQRKETQKTTGGAEQEKKKGVRAMNQSVEWKGGLIISARKKNLTREKGHLGKKEREKATIWNRRQKSENEEKGPPPRLPAKKKKDLLQGESRRFEENLFSRKGK